MTENELAVLRRKVDTLQQTVSGLIALQRRALQTNAASAALLLELDLLAQQLPSDHAETAPAAAPTSGPRSRASEIDVERLNIVEPDGRLRLVISGAARAPDSVVDGITGQRVGGNQAGLIFYNDEGDECGGLTYSGQREENGRYAASGGLMFDQFKQDQAVGIMHSDEDGKRWAGLWVWDRPDQPLPERRAQWEAVGRLPKGPERTAAAQALGRDEVQRVFVGKTEDRAAVVRLCDAQRRERLRLTVDAAGAASIEFLDEQGSVTRRLPDDLPPREPATP